MSSSDAASHSTSTTDATLLDAPLWKYVTIVDKTGSGGNKKWTCNVCNGHYQGSYSRVKAHLLKIKNQGIAACSRVKTQHIIEMTKLINEVEERKRTIDIPLPMSSGGSRGLSFATQGLSGSVGLGVETSGSRKRSRNPVATAFNQESREKADALLARTFYASGLPFHLARSPYFRDAMSYLANTSLPGYLPPGYNSFRTTLLQRERANVDRLLEPIRGTWKQKGVTIVSDGWTDAQRRPLINFMAICDSGPMFIKAVNCEGEVKNKEFIGEMINNVIREVGPDNVVQVITDNAPVCKAAGMIVEGAYPHIFWTPCVVHTLNLALKNICAAKNTEQNSVTYDLCSWITDIAGDVMVVKNFICNHGMRLAIYNEFVNLKLLSVAETRFASTIIMLRRFKLVKQGLQAMVISNMWSTYREDDVGKAMHAKELLLNDIWWDKIDYILSFTSPIYDMLRVIDTDRPSLHLVYDMWDTMIEKVKKAIFRHEGRDDADYSCFFDVVHTILVDRWTKSNTPLHCLAHSLNPLYYSEKWLGESPLREPPQRDSEISEMRIKCFRRYFPNAEDRKRVNMEFAKFSAMADSFSSYDSISDRAELEPKDWWQIYGSSAPMLQALATKLLGQSCSSSCSERNWSTYSFIHSMRRNKIQPQRAEDLVYVHTNLRLLARKTPSYVEGASKLWDVGGDAFSPFDGAGELEVANLSLDEPEMEVMLLDGDEDAEEA